MERTDMKIRLRTGVISAVVIALSSLAIAIGPAGATSPWSVVPSPNHGADQVAFNGISCTSRSFCIGVGSDYGLTSAQPLLAAWSGTAWHRISNAPLATGDTLQGISCVATSWCMAVGYNSTSQKGFAESWNGKSWVVVMPKSPTGGTLNYVTLSGVSCLSRTWCVAVGSYAFVGTEQSNALIEWWNGAKWSLLSAAKNPTLTVGLSSVSCTSTKFCAADGYATLPGIVPMPNKNHVELWNGSAWSNSPTPNRAVFNNDLHSVSCTSATSCVAVGDSFASNTDPTYKDSTAVMDWNGSKWSFAASPNIGNFDTLLGVSCTASRACIAVGNDGPQTGYRTLIEWSSGGKWGLVGSPDGAGTSSGLGSVSCLPGWCLAVGSTGSTSTSKTLSLRYG
jgi:hypothetical protein